MATTRKKKTIITGVTAEEANEALAAYAKATARTAKINAEMDLQFAKIREKYATELTSLENEREGAFDTLQAYATENQEELFAKKKSLDMVHGTIGFRTGNPKLKPLKKFTFAAALELMKTNKDMAPYIRTVEEINKEKLIAERDTEGLPKLMESCGLSVVQEETFFVEPKTEDAQ